MRFLSGVPFIIVFFIKSGLIEIALFSLQTFLFNINREMLVHGNAILLAEI